MGRTAAAAFFCVWSVWGIRGHLDHKPPAPEPQPSRQQQSPHKHHALELDDEYKLLLQEAELAKPHLEAEATKKRIVDVRQQAKAASATVAQHPKLATEAARREEERQTSIQEEAVGAFAMAAETAKLAAAQTMAEEHRIGHVGHVSRSIGWLCKRHSPLKPNKNKTARERRQPRRQQLH